MSELANCLTPLDQMELAREVERLFVMQDKHISEEKKLIFVSELVNSGLLFKDIVAGIRKLSAGELKTIRVSDIISAANSGGEVVTPDGCKTCFATGFISMANKDGYSVGYACSCALGWWYVRHQKIVRWNGKRRMFSKRYGIMTIGSAWNGHNISDLTDEELKTEQHRDVNGFVNNDIRTQSGQFDWEP